MQIIPYFLGFITIANFVLAFTIIFLERKNPTSTWAWLMVLFFIPVFGFICYLIFGRKLNKQDLFIWDTKNKLGVQKEVAIQLNAIKNGNFHLKYHDLKSYEDLYYLHLVNNDAIYSHENDVKIFTDGEEKFEALIKDLENAENHIHL